MLPRHYCYYHGRSTTRSLGEARNFAAVATTTDVENFCYRCRVETTFSTGKCHYNCPRRSAAAAAVSCLSSDDHLFSMNWYWTDRSIDMHANAKEVQFSNRFTSSAISNSTTELVNRLKKTRVGKQIKIAWSTLNYQRFSLQLNTWL